MSDGKGVIFAVVGAVAGIFIGPAAFGISAFSGALAGFAIGSALAPKPGIHNSAQAIADLRVVGTEYGQCIPYLRGAARMAGQTWWNSIKHATTTTTTTGGKGGEPETTTETITYDIDVLYGLTDNIILGVRRIWDSDSKLIWTAAADASSPSLSASGATEHWTRLTVYTGAADQLPDPTYEAAVGAANACAYRGRGSVFIEGLKLGTSGSMRNLAFEVVVDGTITVGDEIAVVVLGTGVTDGWHAEATFTSSYEVYPVNKVGTGEIWIKRTTGAGDAAALLDTTTGLVTYSYLRTGFPSSSNMRMYANGINPNDNSGYFYNPGNDRLYKLDELGNIGYIQLTTGISGDVVEDGDGNIWVIRSDNVIQIVAADFSSHACTEIACSGLGSANAVQNFGRNPFGVAGRLYYWSNPLGIGYVDTNTLVATPSVVAAGTYRRFLIGGDGNLYTAVSTTLTKRDSNGNVLGTLSVPGMNSSSNIGVYTTTGVLWATGTIGGDPVFYEIDPVALTITDSVSRTVGAVTFQDVVGEGALGSVIVQTSGGDGAVGVINAGGRLTIVCPPVDDVVSGLCERAGLTAAQIDVTQLASITRDVCCLPVSQIVPMRQPLELLMSAYFFEMVMSAGKITFVPRGGSSVATIAYLDMGASMGSGEQQDPLPLKMSNDLEIPAQISLSYINIDDDYQTDTQNSDRLISAADGTVMTVQMALGLTPAEAKAVADTILMDQTASNIATTISVVAEYCRIEPTDPVTLTGPDGTQYRMRIVEQKDSYPVLTYSAVLDDVSVLSSQGITSADYTPQVDVSLAVDSLMGLMDIPIARDSDNDAGFYVAGKGNGSPYPGSAIFKSADDVEYERVATIAESAVFGTCTTTLGNWTGSRVFDESSSVTVDVGSGLLTSSTRDVLLNNLFANAMLIGSEIIQFRTATIVSTGIYTLNGLIRGNRGTEWAMIGHAASERCVLLRAAGIRRVVLGNSELGLSRYYKAVTLGRPLSSADGELFTCNAIGLKPFAPVDLRISRDASNNATLTWQRRTRMSVRMIGALGISVPLGEQSEAYDVDVFSDGAYATRVRAATGFTAATATYTASDQTADGLTPGNPIYVRIYQRSAVVGRGYPLEASA